MPADDFVRLTVRVIFVSVAQSDQNLSMASDIPANFLVLRFARGCVALQALDTDLVDVRHLDPMDALVKRRFPQGGNQLTFSPSRGDAEHYV